MRKKQVLLAATTLGFLCLGAMGCKPRTPAQKVEDKMEDAGHEVKQGMERTKENVNDAVKN